MSGVASGRLGHFTSLRMTHTALARKYRPTRFSDLAGQEHVAAGLKGAIATHRVAHAYLLTGPRGVGKTTAARILAMALNCARRTEADEGEPCGACDPCRRIWAGAASLDVVEIDAASNRGVDDARELRERAMYAASTADGYKVYIIDEAHMLTREAWNALLKILEEPPPRVVFVFATTDPQKIANTAAPVLSRVQRFDFRRIGPATIVEQLAEVVRREGVEAEADALVLIAGVAAGGMRDALSLLDQALAFGEGPVTAARVREALGLLDDEVYAELLEAVAERRVEWVFPYVARLVDAGADLAEFVNGVGETLRALMMRRVGADAPGATEAFRAALARHAERFAPGDVLRMLQLLQEAETGVRRGSNVRLAVEALLLRFTLLDRTVELQEVLSALGGSGDEGAQAVKGSGGQAAEGGPAIVRSGGGPGDRQTRGRGEAAGGSLLRDRGASGGAAAPPPSQAPSAASPGLSGDTPTVEALVASWDDVRAQVARRRPMLAAALEHVRPAGVRPGEVVLAVTDGEVHLRGLEKNRGDIEAAIAAVCGGSGRVVLEAGVAPGPTATPAGPGGAAKRLDQHGDRDHRLQAYRAKDQALDAVAEALDLELLD